MPVLTLDGWAALRSQIVLLQGRLQDLQWILKCEMTYVWLQSRVKVGLGWLELQEKLSGKGKVSPEPTQMSASGPGLFHISVNDPKKAEEQC